MIRGIEPLVQDTEPEQPDSSSVIQSRGAVRNIGRSVLMHLVGCSMNIQELGHAIQSSGPLTQVLTSEFVTDSERILVPLFIPVWPDTTIV